MIEHFGKKAAVGADAEARPWEMVGGTGFDAPKKPPAPKKAGSDSAAVKDALKKVMSILTECMKKL